MPPMSLDGSISLERDAGAETMLTHTPADEYPAVSRNGTKVAYSFRQNGRMSVFVVPAGGGAPQQVCDDCGEVEQWSPDGGAILYVTAHDLSGVGFLKVGSSKDDGWLKHPATGSTTRVSLLTAAGSRSTPGRIAWRLLECSLSEFRTPSWQPKQNGLR